MFPRTLLPLLSGSLLIMAVPDLEAQTPPVHHPPEGELFELRNKKLARLDSLRLLLPDSLFFAEGGEYAEFEKWFDKWFICLAPHGDFHVFDNIVKSYWDRQGPTSAAKSNDDPWHEIGPKRRRNNMIGIGPIRTIIISDTDPDHMLCSSGTGGVFFTTNGASTWHNAGTDIGLPHSGCRQALYYPGTLDHWYAFSTFEDDAARNRIGKIGGVYRSINGGSDWVPIADHEDLGGPNAEFWTMLFDRKQDPVTEDHRLFVATSMGLFYCDDPQGVSPTWSLASITPPESILSAYPNHTADATVHIHDIEYLPYDPQAPSSTLCAAARFRLVAGNSEVFIWRFLRSDDDGDTWYEVPNQPAIDPDIEWATVEISQASQASQWFYCQAVIGHPSQPSTWASWVRIQDTSDLTNSWVEIAADFCPGFAMGHAFAVHQSAPFSVIVGHTIDIRHYENGSIVPYTYTHPFNSTGHDDTEDVVGDPTLPGRFWVAHHGGVSWINTNVTPRVWQDKSDGLGVAEVWSMSTSQNKPDYIALGLEAISKIVEVS